MAAPPLPQNSSEITQRGPRVCGHFGRSFGNVQAIMGSKQARRPLASQVKGDGNCFHRALAKEIDLANYCAVKRKTEEFLRTRARQLFTPDFLQVRHVLAAFGQHFDHDLEAALKNLTKDGAYADEVIMQLTALAHNTKLEVESLTTPDLISTLHALDAQAPTVRILIREHRATGIYSLRGDTVEQIGLTDGHIWTREILQPPPGNGAGLAEARP